MQDPNEDTNASVSAGSQPSAHTETFVEKVEDVVTRVEKAIAAWYEKHFNAHAKAGTNPISVEDHAQLIQHVTDAAKAKE